MYFLLCYVPKQALRIREYCTASTVFLSAYALSVSFRGKFLPGLYHLQRAASDGTLSRTKLKESE
jgi:hypothetical protein